MRRVIVAVVVTYDPPPGALERCLDSLVDEVDQVYVVDTGGRADTGEWVGVEVLNIVNHGYGVAANAGFTMALEEGADAVVLLNDDVAGRQGWVAPLVEALRLPNRVGAAQPVLLHADTDPPMVNSRGVQIGPDGAGTDIGDGDPYVAGDAVTEIELFTGGAVAFGADYLRDTGGFDGRWFLYYEDVDLAKRGRELGYRSVLVESSVVVHERSGSTSRVPDRTRFLQERNRLWTAFRWGDRSTIRRAVWLSIRRLIHSPRRVHARALWAGLRGAPAELRRR